MAEAAAALFVLLFSIQFIGTMTYLFMIANLLSRLKDSHADVWESLGSPSLLLNNNLQNNRLVLGWLWGKEYLDLDDPVIVRRAGILRGLLFALLANFALLILLFVFAVR
jgi:hypothetical protein